MRTRDSEFSVPSRFRVKALLAKRGALETSCRSEKSMKTPHDRPSFAGEKYRRSLVSLALLLFVAAFPVWGQIDRGTIQGLVKDPSGAVVPGAKVQIVRIDTNSTIELLTNGEGLYTAPNLPAATYRVVVEKPGFGTFKREPVEVQPRAQASIDVLLQPGGVNDSVTVTTEAPVLDTAGRTTPAGVNGT